MARGHGGISIRLLAGGGSLRVKRTEDTMLIGCPKEIKPQEYRVGLTPHAAAEAIAHGHDVIVETGAGAGIGAAALWLAFSKVRR